MKSKIVMPVPLKGHDKKEELANNKNKKTVLGGGDTAFGVSKKAPHHKKRNDKQKKKVFEHFKLILHYKVSYTCLTQQKHKNIKVIK